MKEKDFDAQLKAALDPLEVPYDASSWGLLEQRLNAPFTEEVPAPVDAVDKAVFHKLQQLEAPYQPAHWEQLSGRLLEMRRLRLRLRISKVAEAAILVLLLLNLRSNWGEKNAPQPVKPAYHGPVAVAPAPSAKLRHQPGTSTLLPAASDVAGATVLVKTNPEDITAMSAITAAAYGNNPAYANSLASPGWTDVALEQPLVLAPEALGQQVLVNALPVALLPFGWQPAEPELPLGSRVAVASRRPSRLYFAAYTSADRNRIQTGDGLQKAPGFTTGFMVGYRQGKWGVEAGLAYSQKQYTPQKKVEIYDGNVSNGYFGSFLGEIQADLVTVPVKVTRRMGWMGKTSVHAVAGATANLATHKTYRYRTVQYPGSTPSSQGNALAAQPRLRQNGRGVLEKGRVTDNAYVTADLGLRLERPIAGRWTAFVEPGFRQSLSRKGLGPNPAKINAFTVQAGVMAAL